MENTVNFNELLPEMLALRATGKNLISSTAKKLAEYGRLVPTEGSLLKCLHNDLSELNARLDDIFVDLMALDPKVDVGIEDYFKFMEVGELYQAWAGDFSTIVNPIEEAILTSKEV